MKSLMMFFDVMLSEYGSIVNAETGRDLKTVTSRVESEGYSFLTITLGDFLADFDESLSTGFIASTQFRSFGRQGGLPRFLSGFLKLIFDTSGKLLDVPNIAAIRAVRQLTGFAKKVELPTTELRAKRAFDGYIRCDAEIGQWEDFKSPHLDWERFDSLSSMLYGQMFSNLEVKLENGELQPKHGPGSTADKLIGNEKWRQDVWTDRLEPYFPSGEWLVPNWSFYPDLQNVQFLTPECELPVRVIGVPKTLKTLRIIAIEPTAMQYTQQALLQGFTDEIKQSKLLTSLIGWKDQTANHRLAYSGSLTGELATLDLSEASDRVSMLVVRRLLRNHSTLLGAVEACRSTRAELKDGRLVSPIRKFASMGSALCFPMEAMVFMIVVLLGIEAHRGRKLTVGEVKLLTQSTRVYGDDIIVSSASANHVITSLESFGLKVNRNKSFWTGKFRESCGRDYFNGYDVTYVKTRRVFPNHVQDAPEIVSIVSMRNQLYKSDLPLTVDYLDTLIKGFIPFPRVSETSSALGRHSTNGYETERWDENLQRPLVKAAVVHAPLPINSLDGTAALMKYFMGASNTPVEEPDWKNGGLMSTSTPDRDHLMRSGRPAAVKLKLRWTSPV